MNKLKPCPFCGGKAEFQQFAHPKNFYKVQCSVCYCGTCGFRNNLMDGKDRENKAIQAEIWNKRDEGLK